MSAEPTGRSKKTAASVNSTRGNTTPSFQEPLAAVAVAELPQGDEWLYEVKLDGYRALLLKDGERLRIRSRNDKDLAPMYPSLAAAAGRLHARQAL